MHVVSNVAEDPGEDQRIVVEHVELVVYVDDEQDLGCFYAPVLTFLGFQETDNKLGLSVWASDSRQLTLVLIDMAATVFGERSSQLSHTSRLTFSAEYAGQVPLLHALLLKLDATILIDPERYAKASNDVGIVFRHNGGAIFEVRWSRTIDLASCTTAVAPENANED